MRTKEKNERLVTTSTLEMIADSVQVTHGAAVVMEDGGRLPLSAPLVCSIASELLRCRGQRKADEATKAQSTVRLEHLIDDLEEARQLQLAGRHEVWNSGTIVDFLRELLVFRRQQSAPREIQLVIEAGRDEGASALERRMANMEDAIRRVVDQVQVVVGVLATQAKTTGSETTHQPTEQIRQQTAPLTPIIGHRWRSTAPGSTVLWQIVAVYPSYLEAVAGNDNFNHQMSNRRMRLTGRIDRSLWTTLHYEDHGPAPRVEVVNRCGGAPTPDATGHP